MKKLLLTFLGFVVVIWATIFFFIPAFSGKITVSPGFETAGITIHYYGILMAVAILAAFIVAAKLAPRYGLSALHVEGGLPRMIIFWFASWGHSANLERRLFYLRGHHWRGYRPRPLCPQKFSTRRKIV